MAISETVLILAGGTAVLAIVSQGWSRAQIRKTLEEPRGEIGGSKRQHLLVRIDLSGGPCSLGTREHACIGERDQGYGAPSD